MSSCQYTSPAGQKATVKLELKPELYFFDEYNYEEILTAWMESTGTANSIKYVTDGNHFPCTVAVAVSDKSFMEHFIRAQTNMMFRGFEGWKEIFAMESTEKEARKILLALLSVADKDIQELSIAEAGAKFASLYTKTLKAGNWAYAIEFGLNSDEVNQLEKVCKINNVEKYFIEGKYDKLSKELQRLSGFKVDSKVSECIDAFSKSDKMAKVLTDNLKYLSTSLKEMKLADSTVKRFCEVEKLRIANEMYSEMLLYIQNTCTLPPICEAASEIRAAIQNETWEQLKLLSEPIYDSVEDFAVDKLLSVIAKQIPMGQIVYDTFKFSVSLANTIFNTSDVQKQKDNMRCVAYIGECLSKWLKANRDSYIQESNNKNLYAKRAVYAYYTLLQLRTMGEKSFRKFEEISGRVSGPWQPGYEEYNYSLEVSSVLDSYVENLKAYGLINNYTTSVVSCPVNVQVYDSVGQLILTIDDQKETSGKSGDIYYYTYYHPLEKDYVKVVILPKEGGYSLKCNATAIGKVNYYVSQMSDSGTVERRKASEMIVYPKDNITITNIASEKPLCKLERDDGESEKYDAVLEETTYTPVETVKMETDKTNLTLGESMLVTASVSPENATYKNVAWISSDTNIATVNSDGVVTAVNSGEVIIKVYPVENKDITDELKITVKEKETEEPILPTPIPPTPTPESPRPPVIVDPTPKPLPDYVPDGSKWDGDTIVTPNGTRIKPDGSIILPGKDSENKADDTIVSKGDGTENPSYNPKDETVIIQEGNTVTHPNEMVQKPEAGSVVNREGTILMPDGTKITSDGVTHRTDGGQTSYKGEVLKPAIPVCVNVNAEGNTPTVVLEGQVYGAEGYDYVIGTDIDCIKTKDYLQIRKNQLAMKAQFGYLQKGTYYAYCHSWIRDKNGKKIFSAWSKPCEFKITSTTPEKPRIIKVKVKGRNVTVTYKKSKNASGYDLVLGTQVKKINGEYRPVAYGKCVIKNVSKNVESVTFKNVKPGTYYVGMHAFNRTSKNKTKVFSPWSNRKTVKIK